MGPPPAHDVVTDGMSAVLLVFGVALASAIAGGFAHGSPTGISTYDVALKAAFGAALALVAVWAAWPWLLAASIVAVLGSLGQPTVIPAAAALAVGLGGSARCSGSRSQSSWQRLVSERRHEEVPSPTRQWLAL